MSSTHRTGTRIAISGLLIIAVFACGEPTSPGARVGDGPSFSRAAPKMAGMLLHRAHNVAPEHASALIGPAGGTIRLPHAGLTLVIPAGALSHAVTITARTASGDLVSYSFAPHGLVFNRPIEIDQDPSGIRSSGGAEVVAGYLAHGRLDVDSGGVGHFAQLMPVHHSGAAIAFLTVHFSGYAFASGLTAPEEPLGPVY